MDCSPSNQSDAEPTSLVQLLRRRVAECPDRLAVSFLADDGSVIAWTYRDLENRALSIAGWLSKVAAPGDRAALAFPPGVDVVAAFFGCLFAGLTPTPTTYPKSNRRSSRLDAIVSDCAARVALTTAATLRSLRLEDQSPAVRDLPWYAVDEMYQEGFEAGATLPSVDENSLALLQYTSGSTSEPRGVMVTHQNLLHNLRSIRHGFQLPQRGSDTVSKAVFWLPVYHDMGLIGGVLAPLYLGGTSYLMAPTTFLRRPLTWLEKLSSTGAQTSGGPTFGYELCCRKATPEQLKKLDLSQWQLAFCGAEPISAAVLAEFADRFGAAGFRREAFCPCYGLAEATLLVTGGQGPGAPRTIDVAADSLANRRASLANGDAVKIRRLVSCGQSLGNQTLLIVDAQSLRPCSDGHVGEIWIRGGSVTLGYWNDDRSTTQSFAARLENGDGPFLRTGDLGFVHHGELFVTGRLKDVIIMRGRNLYPQDVEASALRAHSAVDLGAAFAVDVDGQEQLVVVHQVRREHRRSDLKPVLRAMHAAIVEEHEVDPLAIILVRPASVPVTTSGKVRRSACRDRWLAGELHSLAQWEAPRKSPAADAPLAPDPSSGAAPDGLPLEFLSRVESLSTKQLSGEIEAWMIGWLAQRVDAEPSELVANQPFASLGVDSLTAVEMHAEFEKALGVEVPPMVAWDYPTPTALSQFLAEQMKDSQLQTRFA